MESFWLVLRGIRSLPGPTVSQTGPSSEALAHTPSDHSQHGASLWRSSPPGRPCRYQLPYFGGKVMSFHPLLGADAAEHGRLGFWALKEPVPGR